MLLTAHYVIPVTEELLVSGIEDGAVLVRAGRIADIGPAQELRRRYPDELVSDFGMAALVPGFVNCHTCLEKTILRGITNDASYIAWRSYLLEKESLLSPYEWQHSALLGAYEAASAGYTTLADVSRTGASVDALRNIGLRGIVFRETGARERQDVQANVRQALEDTARWRAAGPGPLSTCGDDVTAVTCPVDSSFARTADAGAPGWPGGPGEPRGSVPVPDLAAVDPEPIQLRFGLASQNLYSCHPELLRELARAAAEEQLPLSVDISGSIEEYNYIRYGHTPFAADDSAAALPAATGQAGASASAAGADSLRKYASPALLPTGCSPVVYAHNWGILDAPEVLAVNCVKLDADDIELLARSQVSVAVCTRANAKLGMGVAPVIEMRKAGIRVGLGTSSAAACDTLDPIDEMRFSLLAQRAVGASKGFITSPDMMRMGTLESARALGMDAEIGSLEVGKRADIVAVDLSGSTQVPTHFPNSAVIHTSDRDDVIMTMVGGRTVYDRRDTLCPVRTVDARQLRCAVSVINQARAKLRA